MSSDRSGRPSSAHALALLDELEQRFDLMRLERLRAELAVQDGRLAKEEGLLEADLLDPAGPRHWRRALSTRARLAWIRSRRRALVDRQRWLILLEGDLKFAMRLRGIPSSGRDPSRDRDARRVANGETGAETDATT